jgi:hypothetical protein
MMTFEEVREMCRQEIGHDDEVLAHKCFAAMKAFMKDNPSPSALDCVAGGLVAGAQAVLDEGQS